MRTLYCGKAAAHGAHRWRVPYGFAAWHISDILRLRFGRRQCPGGMIYRCGRPYVHPAHWHGEYADELCGGAASGHP